MSPEIQHTHKQVPITDGDGDTVFEIDEGIQRLIQYLYDKGIRTFNSCEDNVEGTIWIEYSLDSWKAIASFAFHRKIHEFTEFIQTLCMVELLFDDDRYPDENEEYWVGGDNMIWSASVRFQKELLEDFERLLRETLGGT